jgi:ABC-type multidrug transport system fused ATPase/permease subunit
MKLFSFGPPTFETIKNEYINSLKTFNPEKYESDGKANPAMFYNTKIYKIVVATVFKILNKASKSKNAEYYKLVMQSEGDYTKRKGGKVSQQIISHAEYIKNYLESQKNEKLQYSLLGVFTDIWDILNNQKWKLAFKRSFHHTASKGEPNTILSSFKMLYFALVIVFEACGLRMLSFEYDVALGINPEEAIDRIQKQNVVFMKNVVMPAIKLICLCMNTKDPVKTVGTIIRDENAVKEAVKKAGESGSPLSEIEKFQLERIEKSVESVSRSIEDRSNGTIIKGMTFGGIAASIIGFIGGGSGAATAGSIAGTKAFVGLAVTLHSALPVIVAITAVLILICMVPLARLIIYQVNMLSVNVQKELEMQAEMLNNNIIELKEKLEKTNDEKERERLRRIIDKQLSLLAGLEKYITERFDKEYKASTQADSEIEEDDSAAVEEDDGNFEVTV